MTQSNNRVDLNLFRVLDAIHSHGGISGAARALNLTQPAISHALRRLRDTFDDPLFVRQGNAMVATDRTRSMIADVQVHLGGLYAAVDGAEEFEPGRLEMTFTMGLRDVMESTAFPPLLTRLGVEAPGVTLVSRRVPREVLERELAAGRLDLAVDRKVRVGPRIHRRKMFDEPQVVVVRRGHRLAQARLTALRYVRARHITVTHMEGPEPIDHLLAEEGRARDIVLRCQHYFAACQIVAATDYLLTIPRSYALDLARVLPLKILAFPFPIPAIEIMMFWHISREDDPAHEFMRGLVLESAAAGLQRGK